MNYPAFVNGSYQSQAVTADAEDTINWFFERMESEGATSRSALYPTPGVEEVGTTIYVPGRAHAFIAGREFAVSGSHFIEIDENGGVTDHGTVSLDDNPATISYNGDGGGELLITSGGDAYIFTLATNTLAAVAAMAGKSTMGDYIDGYFLILDSDESKLYLSDLLDGTTWDPLMFAQRSIGADPWVSFKVNGRYVWLLGTDTSEVWYDTGAANFPFAPHPSGLVHYGIAAPFSVAIADGMILWLGRSRLGQGVVLRASGFTPEVISDYPLQHAFGQYQTLSDAVGDTYNEAGHVFYMLTFPMENVPTWTWDAGSGKWTKRGTWISEDSEWTAWRPRWHAMAFGEHRMLDSATGSIYRMASDLALDVDERPLRRLRRAPALVHELQTIFYSSLELDLEPGLGLVPPAQGSDPQAMLRWSNDGGKTWSSEQMRGTGKTGEYGKRVRWDRLGSARRRVFEVTVSDPVPYRITAAYLELGQPVKGARQQPQAGA